MKLEQLYAKARKEQSSLPTGHKKYDLLRDTYDSLLEYDIKSFAAMQASADKTEPTQMSGEVIARLDSAMREGLRRRNDFAKIKPHYSALNTENATNICRLIEGQIRRYQAFLQNTAESVYTSFNKEQERLQSLNNGPKDKIPASRASLDTLVAVQKTVSEYAKKSQTPISREYTQPLVEYTENKKRFDALQSRIDSIKKELSEISWDSAHHTHFGKLYSKNFSEKGFVIKKKTLIQDCEAAEYYEGAVESREISESLKELIDDWELFKSSRESLDEDIDKITDVVNNLQNKKLTAEYFRDLRDFDFTSASAYQRLKPYAQEVQVYERFLDLFSRLKKEKAEGLAQNLFDERSKRFEKAADSDNPGEIEAELRSIEGFARDLRVLASFSREIASYQKDAECKKAGLKKRLLYVKKQAEDDKQLRREEVARKYDFEKQKRGFQSREKKKEEEKRVLAREKQELTSRLELLEKERQDNQETIDSLFDNLGKTYGMAKDIASDVTEDFEKKLEAAKRVYEQNNERLIKELAGLKKELEERDDFNKSQLEKVLKQGKSEVAEVCKALVDLTGTVKAIPTAQNSKLGSLYDKLSQDLTRISSREANTTGLGEIKDVLQQIADNMKQQAPVVVERVVVKEEPKKQRMFDLYAVIRKLDIPEHSILRKIRDILIGGSNDCMPDRLMSINDVLGPDTPELKNPLDVEWFNVVRDKMVDEINFGITGMRISKSRMSRKPYHRLINEVINPYISRCEKILN